MQKLTNLTKDELIELIIREREASSDSMGPMQARNARRA